MFETNTSKELLNAQQQTTFDSSSNFANSPISYGLEAKQENLIASSLSEIKEIDANKTDGFSSSFSSFSWSKLVFPTISSDIGATEAEINEVNDLLDQDIYDRDQVTGDTNYTNYPSWWSRNICANKKMDLIVQIQ